MKRVLILLSLAVFLTVSCEKREIEFQVPNVSFTSCLQSKLKSTGLSNKIDIEFTDKGVQITYRNFEVACDFTAIDVTYSFSNNILNITQQGSPNQADCVCHTDVSYTIDGILQNEVNVIFINGEQVYCHNSQVENSLVGKWGFVDRNGVTLEITESEIMLLPVVPNPTPMETRTYSWVSSDIIEITQRIVWSIGVTRNKVIFHTPDSVTIKNWFIGSTESDMPIYADVTIEKL